MAQFNKTTQLFLGDNKTLFDTMMLATNDGNIVTPSNPIPVSLGSESITITGNVNVGTVVEVSSTPASPVHTHVTEVGTTGILTTPYLPVSILNSSGNNNDSSHPLYVSVSNFPSNQTVSGSVNIGTMPSVTIGVMPEVEVKNDSGNPLSVSGSVNIDTMPSVTIGTMPSVTIGSIPEVEVKNDSGNPLSVSGSVNIGTMPEVEVKNDSGNPLSISGSVNIGTMPEVEIKNDSGNPIPVSGSVSVSNFPYNQLTSFNPLDNNSQLDSLGRLKVSTQNQQWWYDSSVDKDGDLRYQEAFSGTNASTTWIQNLASIYVSSGTDNNGSVIRASRRRHKLMPGISHNWTSVSNFCGLQPNVKKRIGMFTSYNGMLFEAASDDLYVVIRKRLIDGTLVEKRIKRDSFLYDKLDGTGPSGYNFNTSKTVSITGYVGTSLVTIGATTVYNVTYNTTGTAADKFSLGMRVSVSGITPVQYNSCPMVTAIDDLNHIITLSYVNNPGVYSSMSSGLLTYTSFNNTHSWFIEFDGSRTNKIRFGINGLNGPVILHTENFTNTSGSQFENAPSLMERAEIINTGIITSFPSLVLTSVSINIEASTELLPGFGFAVNNSGIHMTVGQEFPILGLAIRAGEPYQRSDIQIQSVTVIDSANLPGKNIDTSLIYWRLLLNPTIGGTVPSDVNIGKTSRQWQYTTATTITGGIELLAGYSTSGQINDVSTVLNFLNMGSNIDYSDSDKIVLMAKLITAGSTTTSVVMGLMNFIESL